MKKVMIVANFHISEDKVDGFLIDLNLLAKKWGMPYNDEVRNYAENL